MRGDEQGYNGWSNYETWCVSLWLGNDEGLYNATRGMAEGYGEEYNERELAVRPFAAELAEYVDELAEMTCAGCRSGASFVADLLGAALSEVDWQEIARNLLSELEPA